MHPTPSSPPYAHLTPDRVLDALDQLGMACDGHLLTLNSYENRVYLVGLDNQPPVVAKFYRPERWSDAAILEEHAFVTELAAHDIPVVPPIADLHGQTLHHYAGYRFSLTHRCAGRAPELECSHTLPWMGRFLGRIHAIGQRQAYLARETIDIAGFGEASRDWLLEHDCLPPSLRSTWLAVVNHALDGVRRCFDQAGHVRSLRLHGDCHPGNILWQEEGPQPGPHFVDFDDSRMGPAIQDLWMLLSGSRSDMVAQLSALLSGYEDFCAFDPRELHLIEALRTLRLLHYSAWLARRWDDPAFPAAFPWFATERYWQERVAELHEQVVWMQEGPLWPV